MKNAKIACIIAVFLFMTVSFSQETVPVQPEKGLKIGKIIFFPSILIGYEYNDNIFYLNTGQQASDIYTARPTFRFELPFSQSYARLSYTPLYRDFADINISDKISHLANVDTLFNFSNGMRLFLKDDFSKGILETYLFDPGGEIDFNGEKYRFNTGYAGIGWDFAGIRGFDCKVTYDTLEFDQLEKSSFYNYDTKGLKFTYYQRLSPRVSIVSDYSFSDFNQFHPKGEEDEFREYVIAVGLKGNLLKRLTGYAGLSYTKLDFLEQLEGIAFSGITGEANLQEQFTNRLFVNFAFRRYPYQSIDENNKYYISNMVSATTTYYVARSSYFTVLAQYFLNKYPNEDHLINLDTNARFDGKRQDRVTTIDASYNHLFTPIMGLKAGYAYFKRNANIPWIGSDASRFYVQMGFGWF